MDALSDVLRRVHLAGAVFLNAEMRAPWRTESPTSTVLAQVLLPEAEHLIEYHLILSGRCMICIAGGEPLQLEAGDLVMLPRGDAHSMGSDLSGATLAVPLSEMEVAVTSELSDQSFGGDGERTRVVCGYLAVDRRVCGPLIEALPPLLRVNAAGSDVITWLQSCLRIQLAQGDARQPGSACVLAKLSELMFVEAVRRYVDSLPPGGAGWLAGLKDPFVGRALGRLHGDPMRAWTVEELAREVGLSRSKLAERFTSLLGKPPMQYLTQWRLNLAAHMLRTTTKPASSVALEVGYESEGAFNRAFKREFGAPPATWRRVGTASATVVETQP